MDPPDTRLVKDPPCDRGGLYLQHTNRHKESQNQQAKGGHHQGIKTNNQRTEILPALEKEKMIREEFLKTKIVNMGFDERAIQRNREQQESQ